MNKDNSVPEDIYRSSLNNGTGHFAAPSQAREVPVIGSMPYDDKDDEGIDPRQILSMLLRRWKIIAATFLTILLLGILYTLTAQPVYQAQAKLLVSGADQGMSAPGGLDFINAMTGGRSQSIETEIEIIQSSPILEGATKRLPDSLQESLERFAQVNVDAVRTTNIVTLSVLSRSPLAAKELSNALGEEYIEQNRDQSRSQVGTATEYVESELKAVRTRLDKARRALRDYKEKFGLVQLDQQAQTYVTNLGGIQTELRQTQAERKANRAQVEQLRREAAKLPEIRESSRVIQRTPAIEAMQSQMITLQSQLTEAGQEYTKDSPEVVALQNRIDDLRDRMSKQTKTMVASRNENPNPLRESLLQSIAQAQVQVWALDARAKSLASAQQEAQSKLADLPEREYELGRLAADAEEQAQTATLLSTKYQELVMRGKANVPSARIVEAATLPKAPISPRKARNFVLSGLLGLMLALALAALVDRMDDRIHSDEDAETYSKLPVIAHIPVQNDGVSHLLINQIGQATPLLESFRMLRANIGFTSLDKPLKMLAVTSSQPGEGKSTTAANLATVMAMSGKQVILVDTDLRRPTAHRNMKVSNQSGFTSVVTGQKSLHDALQNTEMANLRVLTSGPIPPNPFELLESQASRACFQELSELADFIVVDTPPVLAVADTQVVAAIADGVLIVISCKEAGKREIARTRDLLAQTGTHLVGTVLNKVPVGGLTSYVGNYAFDYQPEHQEDDNISQENRREEEEVTRL